jgi:UDP-glucuronate 4-epimerase
MPNMPSRGFHTASIPWLTSSEELSGKRYAESYVDPSNPDPATSDAPYRVFNIGKSQLTLLKDYVQALKQAIGKEAWKNFLPIQLGQVPATNADTNELDAWSGFKPGTPVRKGVQRFCRWYSAH